MVGVDSDQFVLWGGGGGQGGSMFFLFLDLLLSF